MSTSLLLFCGCLAASARVSVLKCTSLCDSLLCVWDSDTGEKLGFSVTSPHHPSHAQTTGKQALSHQFVSFCVSELGPKVYMLISGEELLDLKGTSCGLMNWRLGSWSAPEKYCLLAGGPR